MLHTLLTHPLLVVPPGLNGGASGRRIIHKAMLIAPVNTLVGLSRVRRAPAVYLVTQSPFFASLEFQANWESEFTKWVGNAGDLPALRFYRWNNSLTKQEKTVREWNDCGGVLCVSLDKYASACKPFIDSDKRGSKKIAAKKARDENSEFLRKVGTKLQP